MILRVTTCPSCGAPYKSGICDHCGVEHVGAPVGNPGYITIPADADLDRDKFVEELTAHMKAPVSDRSSPSAVVPLVIGGDHNVIEGIKSITRDGVTVEYARPERLPLPPLGEGPTDPYHTTAPRRRKRYTGSTGAR